MRRWLRDLATLHCVRRRFQRTVSFLRAPHVTELEPDTAWTVLVLAPHPDDEAIWCGGLLKRITQSGGVVDALFLTDGVRDVRAQDALATQRVAEARESCRILGVRDVERLELPDGALRERDATVVARLSARLRSVPYTHVVCPWPYDWHDDHAATYRLLRAAARALSRPVTVILYEAWGTLEPNAAVAIDSVLDAKREAIAAHRSQATDQDFVSLGIALSRFRSTCLPSARHAEAFYVLPSSQLSLLA